MADLNTSDIQGFVLSSYTTKMTCANYVLLKVNDPVKGRKWLNLISGEITTGEQRKDDYCLNIAFTANGLRNIGFTKEELSTFPVAFQEGMATPARQQILGDDGGNAPSYWSWGNTDNPVDILLLVFAKDDTELKLCLAAINQGITSTGGITIVKNLAAGRQPNNHEHFGFLDGVGQPVIEGTGQEVRQKERTNHATKVKAGEFVLGYENEMKKVDPLPAMNDMENFGRNGTYLVFRQLEQHVHTFWNYLKNTTAANGHSDPKDQEKLAAKIIGRWKSGAPVTKYPDADPAGPSGVNEENDFKYASSDLSGFGCPMGAHIRRTNPRDSLFDDPEASALTVNRHRIIRRGRSYGDRTKNIYEDDGEERGLHFICLNSNIERQFEFIQQSWVNNQSFAGLNEETDPLIGNRSGKNVFSIPGCPVRHRIHDLTDFVTTKGGAYFFMPGMASLNQLCKPSFKLNEPQK
jgi:Dyp-type peroxidase family